MIRRCLWVGIVMSLGLAASACGKPSGEDAVKAAEKLADAVCACKDMDCVKQVGDDGAKELGKYKAKLDAKQDAALKAAGMRTSDCIAALNKPIEPPPEAPAPPPAPGGSIDAGAAATPPAPPAPPR
jgi:hypothetical protein